uniref:RNA polymerase sigma factor n=1 Tax=Parabacteroides johnsonii TaxID=387661 RepID=UPI003C6E8C76
MDEQLLIDGCKRGEASARKELYELYAPAMMSVCARYVHDRETARDLGSYRNPEGLKYNHLLKYL